MTLKDGEKGSSFVRADRYRLFFEIVNQEVAKVHHKYSKINVLNVFCVVYHLFELISLLL